MKMENNIPPSLTKPSIPEAVLRVLEREKPGKLLDAPCGRGHLARRLAAAGFDVHALDINAADFEPRDMKFKEGDLNAPLPYPDAFFDYVLSVEGLEHLKGCVLPIEEFSRVLKPGGLLLLTTPNINCLRSRIKFLLFGSFCYFNSKISSARETWMAQHGNPVWFPGLELALENNRFTVEDVASDKGSFNVLSRGLALLADIVNRHFNKAYNARLQTPELLFGENLVLKIRRRG